MPLRSMAYANLCPAVPHGWENVFNHGIIESTVVQRIAIYRCGFDCYRLSDDRKLSNGGELVT